ncbi:MAG: DNA mismatch repair endonuclease MutL, partial [Myxococcales bacterium]|nr:DNA mismatch repair endonuclease MutL [Myxococcales bacterium]
MARIQLLPETLRNQIAAGEVIERPAAVVKELVENALDAGATRVEVDLIDGGRRLVSVRDDGTGMDREDALLSLERHATSKLRSKEDLFAIASYGFRGEALPSMAAVSRFTLLTQEPNASKGTRIEVEGGTAVKAEDAGAPPGTTVEVRDLFWNVPARRKFLKRAPAEQAQCIDAMLRLALPRPDVHFTLRENGRALVQLPAGGDVLERRAEDALGREVRGHLLSWKGETRGIRAHGLAVSPEVEYGSARNVWVFVNGRAVKDRSLTHAVLRAYGELMPHGRYPGAIVFLEVPPAEVDVNVHPAKAEVRLADPRAAWDAIYGGLTPILSRSSSWLPPPRTYAMPPAGPQAHTVAEPQADLVKRPTYFHGLRYLGQLHRTYLVCEGPRGLVLIDQHAAHERVNYQMLRSRTQPAQPLLVPQVLELTAAAAERISAAKDDLAALGIELDRFGETAIAVKSLPHALTGANLPALLADLTEDSAPLK